MLAGNRENGARAVAGTLATDPQGPCTLVGLGTAAAAWDAALVNGMLAHILDYDDTHWISRGHPSCSIVATVLALAEEEGRSLSEMIEAYIVGLQAAQLIGAIANPEIADRGYQTSSAVVIMGCTAAAARLL